MKRLWRWLLAKFHLSPRLVCELSRQRGLYDGFHTIDDARGHPLLRDPYQPFRCKRCNKEFLP